MIFFHLFISFGISAIAMMNNSFSQKFIKSRICRCYCCKSVHIAVVQTKERGNKNCIVNFNIGGTCFFGAINGLSSNISSALLYLFSDRKQRLHLFADRCCLNILFYLLGSLAFSEQYFSCSGMCSCAEPAFIVM